MIVFFRCIITKTNDKIGFAVNFSIVLTILFIALILSNLDESVFFGFIKSKHTVTHERCC